MIPRDFITRVARARAVDRGRTGRAGSGHHPRARRALPTTARAGGAGVPRRTALYKLHVRPPARYSEDIDLVQVASGPIGPVLDAIHDALDGWLGRPHWKQSQGRVTLLYRFESEDVPPLKLKLKVEINVREHFTVLGLHQEQIETTSRWFSGDAAVTTYQLDELLGTKLRALFQRKKARDLFDLDLALRETAVDPAKIITSFERYLEAEGERVSRAIFEKNLAQKERDATFRADLSPLLTHGRRWDVDAALEHVRERIVTQLPGEPWKARADTARQDGATASAWAARPLLVVVSGRSLSLRRRSASMFNEDDIRERSEAFPPEPTGSSSSPARLLRDRPGRVP